MILDFDGEDKISLLVLFRVPVLLPAFAVFFDLLGVFSCIVSCFVVFSGSVSGSS